MDNDKNEKDDLEKKVYSNEKTSSEESEGKVWNVFDSKVDIYNLLFWIIFLGALVPFAAQFLLPFIFMLQGKSTPTENGVEVWNTYVSIVLGVVATVTSLISLSLSFKNTDDSNKANVETTKLLAVINERMRVFMDEQENLKEKQEQLKSLISGDLKGSEIINQSNLADFDKKVSPDEKKDDDITKKP